MRLFIYWLKTGVHRSFSVHKRKYTDQAESRLRMHLTQGVMAL